MRAAAIVLALAGLGLLVWWLRDDATPRADRAEHEAPDDPAARERPDAPPSGGTAGAAKTASVEVLIRRPDDTGVQGVTVRLVADGEVGRAVTGEDGVARFPRAPATLLQVWALKRRLGSVSAAEGERRFEYTVEEMLDLVVRVTCEGVARLPDGIRVTDPPLVDAVYDAERAEVRGRFVPPPDQRSIFVTVTAPGYAPTEVIRGLPRRDVLVTVSADLTPRRRVVIAVTGPRWTADALELEMPNVARQRMVGGQWQVDQGQGFAPRDRTEIQPNQWKRVRAGRRFNLNTREIVYELRPGRYRLRLKGTPVVMSEFDVDRDDVRVAVDLTHAGKQEIVLRGPPEASLAAARLQADWVSIGPSSHAPGEARFSVILPGDREVVLEPRHVVARPAEPLRLVGAGDEVVVNLRLRTLVRFRLPAPTPAVRFVLYRDKQPVAVGTAAEYADGYAVPAEPGRYTLRISSRGEGSLEREIDVPENGLDLGLVTLR